MQDANAAASCAALRARRRTASTPPAAPRRTASTALVALALILAAAPTTPAPVPRLAGDSGGVRRAQPKAVRSFKREGQHESSGEQEPWAVGGVGGEPRFVTPRGPPYRATGVIRPPYYVRGEDKDHPGMVIPMESREVAHTVNLMPENKEWKDHDSEGDDGHPNQAVLRLKELDSSELSADIWEKGKALFDKEPWTDANYNETISKYGLQSFSKFRHLLPKLWFEPLDSDEEELAAKSIIAAEEKERDGHVEPAHEGHPFCVKCGGMLGLERPDLGLLEDLGDPECRTCGFMNLCSNDGRLLNDAEVALTELRPSDTMFKQQAEDVDTYQRVLDAMHAPDGNHEVLEPQEFRPTTTQRCMACGHKTAYYYTAQVRGMDEGLSAFFECVKCGEKWSEKG